jgi:hypothetical protein
MHSARSLVTGALLVALLPAAAIGQRAEAWRDSAQRLHALASALRDSMVRGDSTTQEVARRGSFVIAASPNNRAAAAEALNRFAEISDRWFDGAMPTSGGFRIVVRTESVSSYGFGRPREVGAVVLAGMPDTDSSARIQFTIAPGAVTNTLIDSYGALMFSSASATTLWLDTPPPLSTPEADRRQTAMYALVTGSGHAQRRCAGGDLPACAAAFGLVQSPGGDIGPAFSVFMRADLLLTALSVGGRDAWSRFRSAADSGIEPALVAAAAIPRDSLLGRWRAGLLALRPANGPISAGLGIAALIWSAALLLGALGASRWV